MRRVKGQELVSSETDLENEVSQTVMLDPDGEEIGTSLPEGLGSGHVVRNLLFTTAVVGSAALIATGATDTSSAWYRGLDKPEWQPPSSVFPIVWTTLYGLTAVSAAAVLARMQSRGMKTSSGRFRRSLVLNMALNASWPFVFFRKRRVDLGAGVAGALAISSACLIHRARKAGRVRQLGLVPYAAWTVFAAGLSSEIWLRNEK